MPKTRKTNRTRPPRKRLPFLLGVVGVILLVVLIAGLVTKSGITGKATNPMDQMIQDMIKQRTEEITKQIAGGQMPAGQLPGGQIPGLGSGGTTAPEVPCDLTPRARQLSSTSYYTGPLVDAHLHMPAAFQLPAAIAQQVDFNPPVFDKDISKTELICLFDTEKSKSVVGFYLVPNMFPGMFVSAAQQLEQQYPGRIAPFITPAHLTSLDLTPEQLEDILKSNPGLFKGLGEYAFYKADYQKMSPDDPTFLKIYDLAVRYRLIMMIHADAGQQAAIEGILQKYPLVTFLFHGNVEMGPYAAAVVSKYPNAYFTIDGDLWDIPEDAKTVNLYAAATKEEFITDFKRDYTKVQSAAISRWKNAIEQHPNQFVWGTDRGKDWHFDPEVGALLEESARSFIGQLDPAVQEKFAYQNAERLINEH